MKIPVRNLYYLLAYAWDRLQEAERISVGAEEVHDLTNLLARVLEGAANILIRRGIDRGYATSTAEVRGIRGQIDFSGSLRRMSFERGRAVCSFDLLSEDVQHNRILKAAVRKLVGSGELDPSIEAGLVRLLSRLSGVTDINLDPGAFRSVQLSRNSRLYGFVMDVCRLVCDGLLPTEDPGRRSFARFLGSDQEMGRLFESFVRNFLTREQAAFAVSSPDLGWRTIESDRESARLLPGMKLDVLLERSDRRIVLETKFYSRPLAGFYGVARLRSQHLYQLTTYMDNLRDGPPAEGVLLYAWSGEGFDVSYQYRGRPLRALTLDLGQHWESISSDLKDISA